MKKVNKIHLKPSCLCLLLIMASLLQLQCSAHNIGELVKGSNKRRLVTDCQPQEKLTDDGKCVKCEPNEITSADKKSC